MVFIFDVLGLTMDQINRYKHVDISIPGVKKALNKVQSLARPSLGGRTTTFIENHDLARSVSVFGSTETPELTDRSAKALATMVATGSGTLFIYQGQEIGMTNAPPEWDPSEYKDVETVNYIQRVREQNPGKEEEAVKEALVGVARVARDHARTPVHWDASENAGFSTGKPWMSVNDNYRDINVEKQQKDSKSVLNYWKKLVQLRKADKATWIHGSFDLLNPEDKHTIVYGKVDPAGSSGEKQGILVALNFSKEEQTYKIPEGWELGEIVISNIDQKSKLGDLQPWEATVYTAKIKNWDSKDKI